MMGEQIKSKFIRGELNDLTVPTMDVSKAQISATDYSQEVIAVLNDAVKKGIISGTRKFIFDNPNISTSDELLGTNIISYVLVSIDNYVNKSLRYLQNRISDIINKIVDGENKNGTT